MLKVEIDRTTWLRGEGQDQSFLLRSSDGRKCCMGFAALAAGIDPEDLDCAAIHSIEADYVPDSLAVFNIHNGFLPSEVYNVYRINDHTTMSSADRESELIKAGKKVGIEFSFVNQEVEDE